MVKRKAKDFKIKLLDGSEKNVCEVLLKNVRGGYVFSVGEKNSKVEDLDDFNAQNVAEQLGLAEKALHVYVGSLSEEEKPSDESVGELKQILLEYAAKFVNRLVLYYKISPKEIIPLPNMAISNYDGKNGINIGVNDLFLFVEKSKLWNFQLYDMDEDKTFPRFHVGNVEDLKKEPILKESLKYKFKTRLVPLVVGKIVDLIETEPEETWKIESEEQKPTPTPVPKAELPTSEEVSDVFAYKGDRKFHSRIQIKSLGFPKSRFLNLDFRCNRNRGDACNACNFEGYNMNFEENFNASAFSTYFDTNDPKSAFKVLRQKGLVEGCERVFAKGDKETAITQAVVSDRAGNEAKAWFVHSEKCDLRRGPNWIFCKGRLCRGKYGRIGVLVSEFKSESEVMQPDEKTVEASRRYLQEITTEDEPTVWEIARAMHKKSNLKGEETTRGFVADFLNVGSSVWTKTPEGPKVLAMTSVELGETTTAKSQRAREIVAWLKAGKYESGRKTSAGLAAGAEKIEGMGWVMRKGLLPSADLSFIFLDNMYPHALDEFIESRRNGIIMLSTIKTCELWGRARLKLLSNPTIPFEQHLHKCVALKVYDPKFIARFTFVTFTYGVSPEVRYNSAIQSLTEDEEALLNAAWNVLRWNLSQEVTYTVSKELWPKIMEFSKELELKFGNEEIPLFLRANPHKIATLAYCFALFEGTEPTERHVEQAYQWLTECGLDIELDGFTLQWKSEHTLSNEEYESLSLTINKKIAEEMASGGEYGETVLYKFLEYVARHGQAQMEEISASMQAGDRTVKRRARELKGLGLIKSSRNGYFFTVKGVKFWKRWLKKINNGGLDVPVVPDSKGNRGVEGTKKQKNLSQFAGKEGVTPENEDNEDIEATGIVIENVIMDVKSWCQTNRNERSEISLIDFADFIKKVLNQQPQRVIKLAFDQAILMPSPNPGKAVVV